MHFAGEHTSDAYQGFLEGRSPPGSAARARSCAREARTPDGRSSPVRIVGRGAPSASERFEQGSRGKRAGRRPLRRRFGRRHAARRQPLRGGHRADRQRPGHAARLPGRDPRPGRARWPASPPSRSTSPRGTSSPRAASPNVLVAMNPAALKMNLPELERGGIVIVNEDGFTDHNLRKAEYDVEPARGRNARRLPGVPRPDDLDDRPRDRGHRRDHRPRRGALEEPLRARAGLVDVQPPDRRHRRAGSSRSSRSTPPILDANLAAFRAGYNFGETAELLQVHYEVKPAPAEPGTYRSVNGTDGDGAGPDRGQRPQRPAAVPRQLPDHAGLRAPARALAPQALRRAHGAGRGRDRRRQHGARRRLRRPPRRHRDERPGHGPEGGDDRPRGRARAAAAGDRRPARRALDRDADQDRGRRPADGDPRPPRRVAAAGDRRRRRRPQCFDAALEAVRIAVTLPHAGDPALRHLPGQLVRAVAAPRRRPTCREIDPALRHRARTATGEFLPYLRDESLARPWALPGHARACSTGSAASRRRTDRQHQLRGRRTTR